MLLRVLSIFTLVFATSARVFLKVDETAIPESMVKIMEQPKYLHSTWGVYVKDLNSGKVLYDYNGQKMVLPASTTKLFSVAALLHAFGDDYRFKTPVYAVGKIQEGRLDGNLVLVAQGDLTMGGRQQPGSDTIEFTKLDHIIANNVPGVILTKGDPLNGLNALAKQIKEKGIKEIIGDVLIDDRLFESTEKRGMKLTPMMINENLIDLVINPGEVGSSGTLSWRPKVPGYAVKNAVRTVSPGQPTEIEITSDPAGNTLLVEGTVATDQKDIIRTFSIQDPNHFARAAFIQALKAQGILVNLPEKGPSLPNQNTLSSMQPIAVWQSPPLSEYAKLILKVSHNLGADLIPLLLAAKKGERTFNEGMKTLGDFVINVVKIPADSFVFIDGAGGDENRLTPIAEVALLEYMKKQPKNQFQNYLQALPILGVDGSLEDFGKNTQAIGKIYAKTGTGVSINLATEKFFLTSQSLAGYIEGQKGQLYGYMISVDNAKMPTINDVLPIFEDLSQMSAIIYDLSP